MEARVVQLGWCFGPPGFKCTMKERFVRPIGFEISEKAVRDHGITQDTAARDGVQLTDVLSEFCADLFQAAREHDARLVCHHLEFDAGILWNEMARSNMKEESRQFGLLVEKGLCTMNPEIGKWLRQAWGEDAGNSDTGGRGDANPLKLKVLAHKLLKESKEELAKHHTAGADSVLHRRLGYALYGLSRAPCRLKEESHEKRPLNNGSGVMECALCKERF